MISPAFCLIGAVLAGVSVWLSFVLYVLVPVMYFMPQRGLERILEGANGE